MQRNLHKNYFSSNKKTNLILIKLFFSIQIKIKYNNL